MKTLLVLIPLFLLAGCASDGSMNITKLPISDETVTALGGNITDASTQKEAIYFDARKSRDRAYKAMYDKSGFNVKFELVEVSPGVKIQMMREVSFKEAPRFDQPMPEGPSEHPVWKFAGNMVQQVKEGFLISTGIKTIDNVLSGATDSAQPKYYGTYNPQTAEPYIVRPEVIMVE